MVEFIVEAYDIWVYSEELRNAADELPICFRFKMKPSICMEITSENLESGKFVKNTMFSLTEDQLKTDVCAEIIVCKMQCPGNGIMVGCHKFKKFHCKFKRLMDNKKSASTCPVCFETVRELVQLKNNKGEPSGTLFFTLRLSCFGSSINQNVKISDDPNDTFTAIPDKCPTSGFECKPIKIKSEQEKLAEMEKHCLDSMPLAPCSSSIDTSAYDIYSAEVNGNALTIRICKDNPKYLVTRVYDSGMDCDDEASVVNHNGIDLLEPSDIAVQPDWSLKPNSICDSVIRGDIKYPAQGDMKTYDLKCQQLDATEKYKKKPRKLRAVCLQVDEDNLKRELNGKCQIPKGIEICRKGCVSANTDVFVLKIGRKRNGNDRKNEIELEMRTPKGADFEVKRKETREIQVEECDFPVIHKNPINARPSKNEGKLKSCLKK